MDAGAVAGGGTAYVAVSERRGEAHLGDDRCRRDAAEGLHRLLRPVRRIPAADRGRHRGGCRSLRAGRHARRHRADDGRHDALRGDPGPDGRAAAALRTAVAPLGLPPWQETIERMRSILHRWHGDRTMVRPAVAPTIPLHCRDEFMVACRDLAAEFDVGIHTHLAESKIQAVVGARHYGAFADHAYRTARPAGATLRRGARRVAGCR